MTETPTYAVRPSFLGIERTDPASAICIAGIPYDLGTSNRPGARFGPSAIRQASRMLVDGDHPIAWTDPTLLEIADIGDFRIAHGDIEGTLAAIEAQAKPLNHLVALGGDHTITLALLRALAPRTGPLALVHFDAHVDTWPDSFGQRFGHGSPFYHAIEEGLIDPHRTVQIGIRSPRKKYSPPAGDMMPPVVMRKSVFPECCGAPTTQNSPALTVQFISVTTFVSEFFMDATDTARISITGVLVVAIFSFIRR